MERDSWMCGCKTNGKHTPCHHYRPDPVGICYGVQPIFTTFQKTRNCDWCIEKNKVRIDKYRNLKFDGRLQFALSLEEMMVDQNGQIIVPIVDEAEYHRACGEKQNDINVLAAERAGRFS